jgi:pyruvate dehydrogenase E1 component beta subunit
MGEDIGKMGGTWACTKGLLEQFGKERVIDTPMSEIGFTTMGVGAALYGKRPVVEIMFADFIGLAYDSIANQAAKMRYMSNGQATVPMVIRTAQGMGGGIGAHHSQSIEGWFMNIPGIKIVAPSTPYDVKGLLKSAVRDDNPVLFLEHKALYRRQGQIPEEEYTIPIGKAKVVKEGTDVTVIANQLELMFTLEVASELEKEGISIEIIDPMTIKPLDTETIYESVKKTGKVLVIQEGCRTGGYGAEISASIAEDCFSYLKAPVKRLGAYDSPIPYGKSEFFMIPTKTHIEKAIRELVK